MAILFFNFLKVHNRGVGGCVNKQKQAKKPTYNWGTFGGGKTSIIWESVGQRKIKITEALAIFPPSPSQALHYENLSRATLPTNTGTIYQGETSTSTYLDCHPQCKRSKFTN